jgi:serine/threonine-protein kinase HipA
MQKAYVYQKGLFAGILLQTEEGYLFQYDETYLNRPDAIPVSLSLPLQARAYHSHSLFPFFEGLIPEGYLLEVALQTFKLQPYDHFSILLACGQDVVGSVSVLKEKV